MTGTQANCVCSEGKDLRAVQKNREMAGLASSGDQMCSCRLIHVTTLACSMRGFLRGQLSFMKFNGIEVRAISAPDASLKTFGESEQVVVHGVPLHRRIHPVSDLRAVWKLWRYFRHWPPAIVHAHTPKAGLLAMIAARFAGVPVRIYHLRGLPLETSRGWKWWLLWASEWLACRLAHRVLCVSDSLRDRATAWGVCSPEKLVVLRRGSGNGVDAMVRFNPSKFKAKEIRHRLKIPESSVVLGFVGRISRDKGVLDLAECWKKLRRLRSDLHMVIVGEQDSRDPLPKKVYTELQDDPRVHILGFVEDTAPWYSMMDICILPTYREGFPNVVLEAAAMELPVIATRVTGCIDAVVDGQTGTLVRSGDVGQFQEAVVRYLDQPSLRRAHGVSARKRVLAEFQPEDIWTALRVEYQCLLIEKGLEAALPTPFVGKARAA